MKSKFQFAAKFVGPACLGAGWGLVLMAAGCGREDIQVYKVAKEPVQAEPGAQAAALPPNHPDAAGAPPRLQWKLPQGWQEVPPGQMRVASFKLTDKEAKQADVSVVPLPGLAGGDLANVNRWRSQVSLPPVQEDELAKLAQPVEVGGQTAQLYDFAGANVGSGEKSRVLAAVLKREGVAWFFKMTGEDDLVAQQKSAFVEFLKSVGFPTATEQVQLPASHPPLDSAAPVSLLSATPPSAEGRPAWEMPAGWREVPAGQFLVAKFVLTGAGSAQAAVNVSRSAGDGGGLLANVNRWRNQLGLTVLAAGELDAQIREAQGTEGKIKFIEMTGADKTGQKSQLVGAMVAQAGQTWFYKLMGDAQVVEREKEAFSKFVQGAKY
jgi:hypothetical protein